MPFLDFFINAALLVLWLTWLSRRLLKRPAPAFKSLASTLQKEHSDYSPWLPFVVLVTILLLRPLLYWQLGPAANWTPRLDLGPVDLLFRSDIPSRIFAYSFLSFAYWLFLNYIVLLFFLLLHKKAPEDTEEAAWIRLQFRRAAKWPAWVLISSWSLLAFLLWIPTSYYSASLGLLPSWTTQTAVKGGALITLNTFIFWQYPISFALLLYLLNSYVYLGVSPFWKFIDLTGKQLLRPFDWLPLQMMRVDFRPLLLMLLVLTIGQLAERFIEYLFRPLL